MAKCPFCDYEVPKDATVCPNCGLSLYKKERGKPLPLVTLGLILINMIVFVCVIVFSDIVTVAWQYGITPVEILRGRGLITLLTAMFLHGGILHLSGNMLVLGISGLIFEPRCGRVIFGTLYFASGVIASLLVALIFPWLEIPIVGSSGAISGILGACLVGSPRARIPLFFVLFVLLLPLLLPFLVLMLMNIWLLVLGLLLLIFLFIAFLKVSFPILFEGVPIYYLIGGWVIWQLSLVLVYVSVYVPPVGILAHLLAFFVGCLLYLPIRKFVRRTVPE